MGTVPYPIFVAIVFLVPVFYLLISSISSRLRVRILRNHIQENGETIRVGMFLISLESEHPRPRRPPPMALGERPKMYEIWLVEDEEREHNERELWDGSNPVSVSKTTTETELNALTLPSLSDSTEANTNFHNTFKLFPLTSLFSRTAKPKSPEASPSKYPSSSHKSLESKLGSGQDESAFNLGLQATMLISMPSPPRPPRPPDTEESLPHMELGVIPLSVSMPHSAAGPDGKWKEYFAELSNEAEEGAR